MDDELRRVDDVVSNDDDKQAAGGDEHAGEREPHAAGNDDSEPSLCAVTEPKRGRGADCEEPRVDSGAGSERADQRAAKQRLLEDGDDGKRDAQQQRPAGGVGRCHGLAEPQSRSDPDPRAERCRRLVGRVERDSRDTAPPENRAAGVEPERRRRNRGHPRDAGQRRQRESL